MRGPLVLILLALAASGCHAKFKRAAPGLGEVRTQVFPPSRPYVNLGKMGDDDLVSAVVNVVQAINEVELAGRIQRAVDDEAVGWALEDGLANTLGKGPPFAWTGDEEAGNVLQLTVVQYGIDVPYIGAQGDFTYVVRARIYTASADRVYAARTRCELPIGHPNAAAIVFGGVNNVRALKDMSDGEIQQAFENVARWCGERIVEKMRRHAG